MTESIGVSMTRLSKLNTSDQIRQHRRRSKTFTGCWTCRSRAKKCDEKRPFCARCTHSGLLCEGYGVRLVWPGEQHAGQRKRRLFPTPALANEFLKSNDDLEHELELLDSIHLGDEVSTGLFGVFSHRTRHPSSTALLVASDESSTQPKGIGTEQTRSDSGVLINSVNLYSQSPRTAEVQRELLVFWTTRLSGFMTPIPHRNNIFINIITPIAQQALTEYNQSPAHLALLHAVLAMTAFWREYISGASEHDLGRSYLASSLGHLTQSLRAPKHHHVILAAISTLLIIPACTGEDCAWRVHLRGGIAWVQSVDVSTWKQPETSMMLLQLFGFYEALIPASSWIDSSDVGSAKLALELDFGSDADWCLHKVLGITKTTTECIRQINIFLHSVPPTKNELDELELKIYRSDPTGQTIRGLDQDCTELAQQHALLYHHATHLYFSRCLRRVPGAKVQHFVRSSLDPIRRIHALEGKYNVSGILWPLFIVACEALETESRLVVMRYLDHRQTQGVGNTAAARLAILAVWKEKDQSADSNTNWVEIMGQKEIDMLLL